MEIRRRKFGRKAWKTYLHVSVIVLACAAAAGALYLVGDFLLASPEMSLIHPDQISVNDNHVVTTANVREIFSPDRGRSVLRIPLDTRRRQLESLPWVESAVVRRALPNQIQVKLVERTPIAFVRESGELALADVHGVILDRPLEGDFHFPVVTGIRAGMPALERERRMQLFSGFMQQIEVGHPGAGDQVSEVDLSDANDLRATFSSGPGAATANSLASAADVPLLVHFGDSDFQNKYQTLIERIGEARASAGRIESVDLRFNREMVVNPDRTGVPSRRSGTVTAAAKQDARAKNSPPLAVHRPPRRSARRSH